MTDTSNTQPEFLAYRRASTIPEGLRDIMPAEAKERRSLEARLRAVFEASGYGEIISPTFDFYDMLTVEAGPAVARDMVRFMGADGRLLALRPEMTTTIARVAAQRLRPEDGPHRLYYVANVFREEFSKQGRVREFWQSGVELIGADDVGDDVEVVRLFIEALEAAGLEDFEIGLGHIGFLDGTIEALPVSSAKKEGLRAALQERSLVKYKNALADLGLSASAASRLASLPSLRGGLEVIEAAGEVALGPTATEALEWLAGAYAGLADRGLEGRIIVDLGIWRNFDYYTGLVFEAYADGLGVPLGAGGRYDNLLAEFGARAPAAGFALGMEQLQMAASRAEPAKGSRP